MVTPTHIKPEWYFLPFYAILRSIPNKLFGVLAMFGSIIIMFFLPWIDSSKVRSGKFRPALPTALSVLPDRLRRAGLCRRPSAGRESVLIGQLATVGYFAYFPLLWLLGKVVKPRPLPQSISAPVLKHASEKA